jgi:hypothetical protein
MRKAFVLTAVPAMLLASFPAFSASPVVHMNTDELYIKADAVVVGEVVSSDQQPGRTQAQVRVLQAIKGPFQPGDLATVTSGSGKVYIDESEPVFTTLQINLLYLQQAGEGVWTCVNRADGQKLMAGKNIYLFHDNPGYSVPFKDYMTGLEKLIKSLKEGQKPGPAKTA